MRKYSMLTLSLSVVLLLSAGASAHARGGAWWGERGHRMIATAAADGLPSSMPSFFTGATDQLAYLNPEPDRWRGREHRAMDEAFKYDHYIDLENVPAGALDEPDRYRYLATLYAAGLGRPERDAGFLPYRIHELHQRLATGFARWRTADSERERAWIEERIVNDAGVLGHYVADASQPHHSTIHFNGWAPDAPNPDGYTMERDFHSRFESGFVNAHVDPEVVYRAVPAGAERIDDVRGAILAFIQESNELVPTLYELERRYGFDPATPSDPAERQFTVDRLAAAAVLLRSLWYTAWVESAEGGS